jgi:CheY-like chemotaxis protein
MGGPASIRVLVVDDFEPFRRLIIGILKNRSELQIVSEASDGADAVEKARQLQPDLVLLDIGLPKLNGIEASRRIKEISPLSRILLVPIAVGRCGA